MSTIQERIETVLAEHHYTLEPENAGCTSIVCRCSNRYGLFETYRTHVAAMLAPLIREAQAQVLIEFADGHRIPKPMFQGRTMRVTVNDLLRAKAAELRSPAIVGPDCRDKKHRACDGTALDEVLDEIIHCQCPCHQ